MTQRHDIINECLIYFKNKVRHNENEINVKSRGEFNGLVKFF